MYIELVLGLGMIWSLAFLMVYVTSGRTGRLKWEAIDPRLKRFRKYSTVTEDDKRFLERYSSVGMIEYAPPDADGVAKARLVK